MLSQYDYHQEIPKKSDFSSSKDRLSDLGNDYLSVLFKAIE